MRVLMFGWEFPPYMSGGLGTACESMAKALARKGTEVVFVMPNAHLDASASLEGGRLRLRSASGVTARVPGLAARVETIAKETWENNLSVRTVDSLLFPYATPQSYKENLNILMRREYLETATFFDPMEEEQVIRLHGGYGPDLMSEVYRYSLACANIALQEDFDVIHCHDWMTYPAGILASRVTGKPLVAHMHAMEHDRSGDNMNPEVAHLEWAGLTAANKVVAVSHYTKNLLKQIYRIPDEKIQVVHNAVSRDRAVKEYHVPELGQHEKTVLFMGRVTFQKGPDYFVEAARLVLERIPNVHFVMAGSGDMLARMVRRVAQLRLGSRFHFTGFLRGEEVDHMYALSDLYVMPSVSEPFGIAPLEAMVFDTPVLITRQSGVSEVIHNALKVDFWDVRGMADKICAVLTSPALAKEMAQNCREELKSIKWENAADSLNSLYAQLTVGG